MSFYRFDVLVAQIENIVQMLNNDHSELEINPTAKYTREK